MSILKKKKRTENRKGNYGDNRYERKQTTSKYQEQGGKLMKMLIVERRRHR